MQTTTDPTHNTRNADHADHAESTGAAADPEQERAWNGYEGAHWARHQDRWDAVNEGFNEPLLTAAAIGARDRVLDVGCGAGRTTRLAAARAAHGWATGLDLSAPMLTRASESAREEGVANATFERGDAQTKQFEPGTFDVMISRYGVMYFADPVAAFTNIGAALRPGGRMAFVCAADPQDNEWLHAMAALRPYLPVGGFGEPGGPGMFSLADPDHVREVLTAAGFGQIATVRTQAYGVWGRDADDAAAFLLDSGPGRHLISQAGPDDRQRARRALTDALRGHERDGAVRLRSTCWLVTAETSANRSAEDRQG
ncbi:methyltransferase domain-containing protein [Streptomyces sp. N2-109]|uniref:Methyltransferase domain-containing protein n=1 Tax=Streptomyces gossypii TaxID=2883101 RepID=A0ABT2JYE3_9ACTN|nr:class I SAM-dependent methyltransferase [Streptomyces gossypii]MCT2592919.1 methyltransferase domain-containing protein [Streptomyces gossypii]